MNNYKTILGGAAAAAMILVSGADALAIEQVRASRVANHFSSPGGEFLIQDLSGVGLVTPYLNGSLAGANGNAAYAGGAPNTAVGFATFCLEHNENISVQNGGTVYNYDVNLDITGFARNGGVGVAPDGVPGADPVSVGTALLYSMFSKGTLAGYNYTVGAGRVASAANIQQTIWWLEDEIGSKSTSIFDGILIAHFGSLANAKSASAFDTLLNRQVDASGYGVFALNLGPNSVNTGIVQDVLIWDGTGLQRLPDGGTTLLLLGIGMTGMVAMQRRFRKIA